MSILQNKRAVVAGVANKQSIAWIIAQALYAHGARIAFLCLESNMRRVKKLARQVDSEIVFPCDVRDDENIRRAFENISTEFDGALDILVHSIAFANLEELGGDFVNVSRSGWNLALEVSAYSLVAFARCARPLMKAAGGGSIFTLTFAGGDFVVPGYNVMGIAKAALNASVRYLAYYLGPDNIRINAISPGPVKTLSSMMVEDFENSLDLMETHSPLLRNVTPDDLGNTAVYLASDMSSGFTGAVFRLECGMDSVLAPSVEHPKIKKIKRNDRVF